MIVFVVPCHGRHRIAEACLRQLARTCATLEATAVLVSDEVFFAELAFELGFRHVEQANTPLGRKWNDGFELAARELEAEFLVPFGSDDVIDARLLQTGPMPGDLEIRCARQSAVVSPDGRKLLTLTIPYVGGDGVRILPRALLERVGFRPAGEDRDRAIDGSIGDRLLAANGRRPRFVYRDLHPLQIVDFKSPARDQRNSYDGCRQFATGERRSPWAHLAEHYPAEFVADISAAYRTAVAA